MWSCSRGRRCSERQVLLAAGCLLLALGPLPARASASALHAGALAEGANFSFELPRVDSAMVTLLFCLLGVPMVTATIAFLVVEVSARPSQSSTWETAGADAYPAGSMLSTRGIRSRVPTGSSLPQFGGANGSRVSLPGPRAAFLGSPTYVGASTMNTLTDGPSLPGTAHAPPAGGGGGFGPGPAGSPGFTSLGKLGFGGGQQELSRVSPLSTALLVKNPAGATVRLDGEVTPHPQEMTINVVSVKDKEQTPVLCAKLSEVSEGGPASIRVETTAKSIPVAVLDTRRAVFQPDEQPPPFEQRCVVLHRVGGEDGSVMGPACAWIAPAGDRRFGVHYLMGEPGAALTVTVVPGGRIIESVVTAQGQLIARREEQSEALWVRQGVDIALMVCIALALQKLRS